MKPTPVLHVNIDNLLLPITLPLLHQIFSKFGIVEKIITFSKNSESPVGQPMVGLLELIWIGWEMDVFNISLVVGEYRGNIRAAECTSFPLKLRLMNDLLDC